MDSENFTAACRLHRDMRSFGIETKAVEWEAVEADYRAGDRSLGAMGNEQRVPHVTVKKKVGMVD